MTETSTLLDTYTPGDGAEQGGTLDDDEETAVQPEIVHVGQHSIYLSTDPASQLAEARERAKVLVEVVNEQGLSKRFGSSPKPHVFVEGWQFLASQFGLIPEIEWTRELEDGAGWEARSALRRLSDGQIISSAEAECRFAERNWKGKDSYAVRSMAQTRAVSKVCRIALSSVMVMAGFNATPAEEMDGVYEAPPTETPKSPEEPHCPACLDVHGALVAVTGPHDKKPYWRCTADPLECGGHRVYQGKDYSWSGWRTDFANALAEYQNSIIKDDPQEVLFDTGRGNYSDQIVRNTMELAGLVSEADAKLLIKPGLILAISEGSVDVTAALGGELSSEPSDEELRAVAKNLTLAEADMVAACAARVENERPFE